MTSGQSTRLNKFISDSGHCSRREADKLIEANRVRINGKTPELGSKVSDGDEVTIDGLTIYRSASNKTDRVYLAYNKPIGITCTTEQTVKGNIIDAIDHDQRIFPIGRLDKPSEGLILLTTDGDIVNKILRAENAHDKEYLVTVDKPLGRDFASKMSSGIPILNTVTKPCKVSLAGRAAFNITLTEGLNRQIRRMCEYLGYRVVTLKRLRIMNIELAKLRPGQWRNLSKVEIQQLNEAIVDSSSQATANKQRPTVRSANSKAKKSPTNHHTKTGRHATSKAKPKERNATGRPTKKSSNKPSNKPGSKSLKKTAKGKPVKGKYAKKK